MTLSETCIRRPVLTTLVTASIIVLGIFAYRLLAVAALPTVDLPTISLQGRLPGASAETMAASVAAAARNISLDDIRTVVAKTNSNTPVGTLNGPKQSVTLTASSAMTKAEEYRKVVVAYRNGAPVYLDQVARVIDSVENDKIASWFNNERAIVLAIQRQPDANTVAVVDAVRSHLPQYEASIPPSIRMQVLMDRSIVMLENIVRHVEGGMRPFEAALKGAREIGFTIISITFSLIAVFVPVLLMGGMVGRVFREFAVTVAVAIIVSGFVSLTLTPMLCARVLHSHREGDKQNIVLRIFEALFKSCLRAYEWSLDRVLRYKAVTLAVTLASLGLSVWLYIIIPKGFFPTEDTGFISASSEGGSDISFQGMVDLQRQVAEIIRSDPAVDYVNSTVGAGGPNPTLNIGRLFIALKPRSERHENSTAVIQRLRNSANTVPGMAVYFQNVQNINITGRISKSEYQYTLQSSDNQLLYDIAPKLRDRIAEIEGLRDVTTDLYIKNPQMTVEIDRETAAVYGVTIDQIRQELFNAFGARQVASIYTPTNDYQVILESQPQFQADPSQLQNIFVKTNVSGGGGTGTGPGSGVNGNGIPSGTAIPLSVVTRIVPTVGPLQVNHQGNQPAVTISVNLAPGHSLGPAVDGIHEIQRAIPLTITVRNRLSWT